MAISALLKMNGLVATAIARAAGDEHYAYEEYRRQAKDLAYSKSNHRQNQYLPCQGNDYSLGVLYHPPEILQPQGQSQIEHQDREDGTIQIVFIVLYVYRHTLPMR